MELRYKEGQKVQVYDVARKRWYKAVTLYCVFIDQEGKKEAWECELNNGNRGDFDHNHMREDSTA